MKVKHYLFICLVSLLACTKKEENKRLENISATKKSQIDSLFNRYLSLGRFSGSVLIQSEGKTIYHQHFGLANYENEVPFTKKSVFKIKRVDLTSIGFEENAISKNYPIKQLVTGYRFHNYRGEGMELQPALKLEVEKLDSINGLVSVNDIATQIALKPEETVDIFAYTENDGFSYAIRYQPADQFATIILSNRRHPVADEISNSLKAIIEDKPYQLPLARHPQQIDSALLLNYEGTYALNAQMKFEIISENDSLFVILGPNKLALIPQSAAQFYMVDNDAAMRFITDSLGKVSKVALLNGFLDSKEIAVKVKN